MQHDFSLPITVQSVGMHTMMVRSKRLPVPGKHDTNINTQTVYTATTQIDFVRNCNNNHFTPFYFKLDSFNVLKILL